MKKIPVLLVLLVISLFPLLDLFHPGLPVTHDGQDHVARIANFYQSVREGNMIPRWAGNLNWGYGHPILMFLYPLPSYIASIFHYLGDDLVDSVKIVFGIGFITSMLSMYLWAGTVWNKKTGLICAIFYGFAPYRFVDFYVRGAIGEHLAFVFPPLILYFMSTLGLKFSSKKTAYTDSLLSLAGLSISFAGLVLSHNAISLMFIPVFILYFLYIAYYMLPKFRLRFFSIISIGLLLGLGLSAFFWIPAFFEGKYTLRDIVTRGEFTGRFVPWNWFIYSAWNYGQGNEFTKSVGLMQLVGFVLAIYLLFKTRIQKDKILIAGLLAVISVSIFMMTGFSEIIWQEITLLQKFQFPWRFLSVVVFAVSVVGGWSINAFTDQVRNIKPVFGKIALAAVILLVLIDTFPMWRAINYSAKPASYYTGVYEGTTDTGESSPIWSVRFMESKPLVPATVISGNAQIIPVFRNSTQHDYLITANGDARIAENTLYFPGWEVLVNGKKTYPEFQDPQFRGLITYMVPAGENKVSIRFINTKLRTVSEIISLFSILVILPVILLWCFRKIYPLKNKLLSVIK